MKRTKNKSEVHICTAFTVCTSFTWILQKVPAKFMLNIAGNGLSLMKDNMMAQVLRTHLLVQFIRWLQKYQLRHSHSDKGTIYIIYFESSDDNVRILVLVIGKLCLAQYFISNI